MQDKIIQISTVGLGSDFAEPSEVYGLSESGSLYVYNNGAKHHHWVRLAESPERETDETK